MITLYLQPEPWDLFWALTRAANTEVGAFGYVTEQELDGWLVPVVDEIFLIDQEVSPSKIDFDEDALHAAIAHASSDNRLDDLHFCIHSHCNHSAFWSGTDETLIEQLGETGTPYFYNAIFNKSGETACRLDVFRHGVPGASTITQDCTVAKLPDPDLDAHALDLLELYTSRPAPSYFKPGRQYGLDTRSWGKELEPINDPAPLTEDELDAIADSYDHIKFDDFSF